MTLRKLLGALALLALLALAIFALVLAHDAAPAAAPTLAAGAPRMQAIVYRQYGSADVLRLEEVARPVPAGNEVLVRVRAASLNPLDWHFLHGTPYIMRLQAGIGRPTRAGLGSDFAGTVVAVGSGVRRFKPGDEIFGTADGTLAEYVVSTEAGLSMKPANMSFQQAAAVPIAGLTALQGLRDAGGIRPGAKVLVNGAAGGVGTFAVQIARSLGAEVTGVCSTRNVELVRALGADHVIDYTTDDYTRGGQRYDLILDTVGNHSPLEQRRVLAPRGAIVLVGAPSHDPWLGPMSGFIKGYVTSLFVRQKIAGFIADAGRTADLDTLRDLMQAGTVTPVIDRSYRLDEAAAAFRYLEAGHARGKVVIDIAAGG
jgi:NADPH:quinone reductase-like Zn-dependent oxidoreductase